MRLDVVPDTLYGKPVTSEMRAGVRLVTSWLQSYAHTHRVQTVHPEISFEMDGLYGHPVRGTSDLVVVAEDEVCVVDYKFGRGWVDAAGNAQMQMYAIGAAYHVNPLVDGRYANHIRTVIIQPRTRDPVREHVLPRPALDRFFGTTRDTVNTIKRHMLQAPRYAGDHCNFCRLRPTCDTYAEHVFKGAGF
jgi:hypothetical protein